MNARIIIVEMDGEDAARSAMEALRRLLGDEREAGGHRPDPLPPPAPAAPPAAPKIATHVAAASMEPIRVSVPIIPSGPEHKNPAPNGPKDTPDVVSEADEESEPLRAGPMTIDESGALVGVDDVRTVGDADPGPSAERPALSSPRAPPPPPLGKASRIVDPTRAGKPAPLAAPSTPAPPPARSAAVPATTPATDKPSAALLRAVGPTGAKLPCDGPAPQGLLPLLLAALPRVGDRARSVELSSDNNRRTALRALAEGDRRFRVDRHGPPRPYEIERVRA